MLFLVDWHLTCSLANFASLASGLLFSCAAAKGATLVANYFFFRHADSFKPFRLDG
jgi:hypothetical protein